MLRRFLLIRDEDVNGKSGTGRVAEGVEFENGQVAYSWLTSLPTVTVSPSISTIEKLHSHGGVASNCRIEWVDELHDDLEQRAKRLKTKKLKELLDENGKDEGLEELTDAQEKDSQEETEPSLPDPVT